MLQQLTESLFLVKMNSRKAVFSLISLSLAFNYLRCSPSFLKSRLSRERNAVFASYKQINRMWKINL